MSDNYGKAALSSIGDITSEVGRVREEVTSQGVRIGYAYNTGTALRRWRASLAKVASGTGGVVNIVWQGDSISEGGYATMDADDFQTKGYVGRVRTALQEKYGDVGKGLVSVNYPYGKPQWKLTGNWNAATVGFGVMRGSKATMTAGESAEFAFNGSGISVFFGGTTTTGTVTISIDGGEEVAFNTATTSGTDGKKEYKVTGLVSGPHTVKVTKSADGKVIYLLGGAEIKGSIGICVNNCSKWGERTTAAVPETNIEISITRWQPALTVIALLANDAGNTTPENYRTNILKLVAEGKKTGDVLLLSTGISQSAVAGGSHDVLNEVLRDIALSDLNIAYLDLFNRWGGNGPYVKSTLGFLEDNVHPNAAGHIDIASAVFEVIHGSGLSAIT